MMHDPFMRPEDNFDPNNPFMHNVMVFGVRAIHDGTGSECDRIISIDTINPSGELDVRRKLLNKAYQAGWRVKNIERLDNNNCRPA